MILFSLGLPGRFAEWCDAAAARLAMSSGGDVVVQSWPPLEQMFGYEGIASTLDKLARLLIESGEGHVLIGARQPDQTLRRALAEPGVRFLLALDDPCNAVAEFLAATGADPNLVVRAIANSCPLLMQYEGLAGALTLRADRVRDDPAGTIAAIAAHYDISAGSSEIDAIADDLAARGIWPPQRDDEAAPTRAAGVERMIEGALSGYREHFSRGQLSEIVWTRDLFIIEAGKSPAEPIDVAGGIRILVFGPYIQLPAGAWTAHVIFGFSQEAVGHTFQVDAYAEGQLACTTFRPEGAGARSADVTFSLGEPGGKGVEVRITVASDDAQGQMALGKVVLRRLSTRQVEGLSGSDVFTAVLDL